MMIAPAMYMSWLRVAASKIGPAVGRCLGAMAREYRNSRKVLQAEFARRNGIRNRLMHPVKDRRWSEDDFQFVQRLREAFTQVEGTKPIEGGGGNVAPIRDVEKT